MTGTARGEGRHREFSGYRSHWPLPLLQATMRRAPCTLIPCWASLRLCFLLLSLLAIASPLLVTLLSLAIWSRQAAWQLLYDGDLAVLELGTFQASRGLQLIGPYSRFGWHHPGPSEFYLLAPLYLLSGRNPVSLFWTSLLVAVVAAAAILVVAYRRAIPSVFYSTAVLLPIYMAAFGPIFYLNPWNPFITILPFTLLLLFCVETCAGRARFFPVVVFLSSFLVQTHISYAPLVAATVGVTFLLGTVPRLRNAVGLSGWRFSLSSRVLLVALLVAGVMWLPPLWEQLTVTPGNFTKLYQFYTTNKEPAHGLYESFALLSRELPGPLLLVNAVVKFPIFTAGDSPAHVGASLLQLLLVHCAWYAAIRQRLGYRAVLCTLGVVGFWAGLWATTRIIGSLEPYLVAWATGLGLVQWIGIASVLIPAPAAKPNGWRQQARPLAGFCGAAAILLTLAVTLPLSRPILSPLLSTRYQALAAPVRAYWEQHSSRPLLVRIHHPAWPVAAAVILDLIKSGVPVSVDVSWSSMFGAQLSSAGLEDTSILITDKASASTIPALPRADVVSEDASNLIYGFRFPAEYRVNDELNLVAAPLGYQYEPGKPVLVWVRLVAKSKPDGDYALKARLMSWDGSVQAEASAPLAWDDPRAGPLESLEREYTLPLPVPASARRGLYRAEVEVYRLATEEPLLSVASGGGSVGSMLAGSVLIGRADELPRLRSESQGAALYRFGDRLDLVGIDPVAATRDEVSLDLEWRARAMLDRDYTMTVQLLSKDGKLVAQTDGYPWGGGYPTSAWKAGEIVRDSYRLTLPKALPQGTYTLIAAVYSLETSQRLPVSAATGRLGGDYATLTDLSLP